MKSWYELRKLPTIIFGKIQKPVQIKGLKMVSKEKNFGTYLVISWKQFLALLEILFKNKNKFGDSEDFW